MASIFVVEHQDWEATIVEVVARLLGLDVTRFLTAEGALDAVECAERAPDLLVTDLLLPGLGGLSLIRTLAESAPSIRCVLLSSIPLGLPPNLRGSIDAVVKVGPWTSELGKRLGVVAKDEAARVLGAIESGDAGFDAIGGMLERDELSSSQRELALRYLAAAFDPDRVLAVLERIVVRDSSSAPPAREGSPIVHENLHQIALDLAIRLGGAGFEVVREIAESSATAPGIRGRAMRHLARQFPHDAVRPVLEACLADLPLVRMDASHALLESAQRAGAAGGGTLGVLAETEDLPLDVRARALERLAIDLDRRAVRPILDRALRSKAPEIVQLASLLLMKGDGVDVESLTEELMAGDTRSSLDALAALAKDFPKSAVLPILEHFQGATDVEVRLRAFELAMSRADDRFEDTLERAIFHGKDTQRAALTGALELDETGFAAVSAIAESARVDPSVRVIAARMLGVRFSRAQVVPVLSRLVVSGELAVAEAALLAAVQLGASGLPCLKEAQMRAPIPRVREAALRHFDEHAPDSIFRTASKRGLRDPDRGVRATAVEIATRRSGADFAHVLDMLASARDVELEDAALDGALGLEEAGFLTVSAMAADERLHDSVRKRARRALVDRFGMEELVTPVHEDTIPGPPADVVITERSAPAVDPRDVAGTKPVPPADSVPPNPIQPGGRRFGRNELRPRQQHVLDGTFDQDPAVKGIPPLDGLIPLEKARLALEAALRLGPEGFRALWSLAESKRVPTEIRIPAIRHLGGDFPDHDVRAVLEAAMTSDDPSIQNAGLGASMLRRETMLAPIEVLARSDHTDEAVRIRAVRFLASGRFERHLMKPILEDLFEEDDVPIRRAALEGIFTSIKFIPNEAVEEHLINLLTEHESFDVKVSAAKALGAFGEDPALRALVKFTGLFAEGPVKEAAEHALSRIRSRRSQQSGQV